MGTTVLAIAVGLMLALCLYAVLKAVIRFRLARHADLKFETYIKAVLAIYRKEVYTQIQQENRKSADAQNAQALKELFG